MDDLRDGFDSLRLGSDPRRLGSESFRPGSDPIGPPLVVPYPLMLGRGLNTDLSFSLLSVSRSSPLSGDIGFGE